MRFLTLFILFVALFAATALVGQAQDSVLQPKIPPADPAAKQCVEPTEVMRKKHMDFILHHRDETVHKGIRTTRHSLVQCINCHVQPTAQGVYPRHTSDEHFCTSCHTFSSVSIDCFSCHADRPEKAYANQEARR